MNTLIDLSHELEPTIPIYPGDPQFAIHPCTSIQDDGYSVHSVSMGSHTGTHIDAPSHFFADGLTIDQLPLPSLVGPALVVDVSNKAPHERIVWSDLAPYEVHMRPGVILLLYTGWSAHWHSRTYFDHPFLDADAAACVLATGIRVLGVDTLSPDETGGTGPADFGVHEKVLGAGGVIAENLTNLGELVGKDGVKVGLMPVNLKGSDGAPVRAFAFT